MRPLKLTMTAFGPYKDREIIDFAELREHRLFVVSGNTGAGKTSIFDAICFALYGEASGEDRSDKSMLRSHFADDGVYTSVDFEFELKGRTYRILRQLAHVRAGNKNATGDKYEFYETTDGSEKPMTDRFIVSQIDERIQRVIGLTKDQFSQIVMLPQGEFRKLLTSETENKEEILRRIFKTSMYKVVAEMLNDRRRDAQKAYDELSKVREIYIGQLKAAFSGREGSELNAVFAQEQYNTYQIVEALEKEIEYLAAEISRHREALDAENARYQAKMSAYHQAQTLNAQFDELDQKTFKKEELERRLPEIDAKKNKLALAEKAMRLVAYERQRADAIEDVLRKQKQLEAAAAESVAAQRAWKEAAARYEAEEANREQREQAMLELERLQSYKPTVQDLDLRKQRLDALGAEANALAKQLEKTEADIAAKQAKKSAAAKQVHELEELVRVVPAMTEQLADLRGKAIVLRDYMKLADEAESFRVEESKTREVYEQAEKEYAELEERWLETQAGMLALHLHDGKPCPVCGSEVHPMKASVGADAPSKELLERKRQAKQQTDQAYLTIKAKLDLALKQLKEKANEVASCGFQSDAVKEQFDAMAEAGKALATQLKQRKDDQELLDRLKAELQQAEASLDELLKRKEALAASANEKRSEHVKELALYEVSLASIPEEIRTLAKLTQQIQITEALRRQLEESWNQAQAQHRKAVERHVKAESDLNNATTVLEEAQLRRDQAIGSFNEALAQVGFVTAEAYRQAKLDESSRAVLEREIEQFTSTLAALRAGVSELAGTLEGKERADLAAMQRQLQEAESQIGVIHGQYQRSQNDRAKALEAKASILESDDRLRTAEKKLQTVKDLYDIVRGENSRKISFERYLQIEFLEKIIQAANHRLQRISNGQYYLVRSDRLEKHRRQSGLGLDVYDNYTGLMRDVKTLSGGEKFNASLCLALGLADIIQSYEGGIALETMFIDEGFGSLDEESLNKAIDTLIELQQSGRMIGIISHVQELKSAIPAVLEVRKTKEGHSYTEFVVS